jgi:Zinc knuckle
MKRNSDRPGTTAKTDRACWKCGEKGHYIANCPRKDLSVTQAVLGRMKSFPATPERTAEILFELSMALDKQTGSEESSPDQTASDGVCTVFEQMITDWNNAEAQDFHQPGPQGDSA